MFLYPQTYYPGTTDATRAVPVEVQYDGEASGIDITLLVATGVTIRGRVLNTITVRPRRQATVQLYPRNPSSRAFLTTPATVADTDGRFEMANILPGSYMLTASWEEDEQRYTGRLAVEVANGDVDGLTVVIDTGLQLSGRVRLEGGDPFDLAALTILLTSSGESPASAPSAHVQADGQFLIEDVLADTYRLTITGPAGDLYLKSVTLGGEDVLNPGLDLTNGTARGTLNVLLGTGAGQVDGRVLDEQNNPLPGARVALVPSAMLRSRTDLYRTASADIYGHFAFSGISPGEYKLFAWPEAEAGAAEDPDFLRSYESYGVSVTLQEKGQLTMRLQVIPSRRQLP
jgi:hypothetical protein